MGCCERERVWRRVKRMESRKARSDGGSWSAHAWLGVTCSAFKALQSLDEFRAQLRSCRWSGGRVLGDRETKVHKLLRQSPIRAPSLAIKLAHAANEHGELRCKAIQTAILPGGIASPQEHGCPCALDRHCQIVVNCDVGANDMNRFRSARIVLVRHRIPKTLGSSHHGDPKRTRLTRGTGGVICPRDSNAHLAFKRRAEEKSAVIAIEWKKALLKDFVVGVETLRDGFEMIGRTTGSRFEWHSGAHGGRRYSDSMREILTAATRILRGTCQ